MAKDPNTHRGQELIHELGRHATSAPKTPGPKWPSLARPAAPVGLTRVPTNTRGPRGAAGHSAKGAPRGRKF